MEKYLRRPLEVECEQLVFWDLNFVPEIVTLFGAKHIVCFDPRNTPYIQVATNTGITKCFNLDWVCEDITGTYVCKDNDFVKLHSKH